MARLLNFPKPDDRRGSSDGGTESRGETSPYSGLTAQEREFLPALLEVQETPPPPYQRALIWILAALVGVALLWSVIGSLDVVSTAPGRFIPDGRVKVVQVTDTAIVRAIHVKEGQRVKEGDLLLELDPTVTTAELTASTHDLQGSELDAARLTAELGNSTASYGSIAEAMPAQADLEEQLRRANEAAYQSKLSDALTQVAEKRSALAQAEITLHKMDTLRGVAQEKNNDSKALLDDHFISRVEYLKDYEGWVAADQDYAAQVHAVEQARQAEKEAEQSVEMTRRQHRADLLKALNDNASGRADLQGQYEKTQRAHSLKWVRAPVSGYVQSVMVTTTGGVVTPAQNLVTIIPEGTPLIVEATLSNDDIGYVKAGQPVEIKIDTYPFQKYGTLKGTLSWISPDAEEPRDSGNSANADEANGDIKPAPNKAALTYRVHVTPDPGAALFVNGRDAPLRPGMSVQADILTDKRRIYEFFLSPLVKYLDEGTHVR